MRKKAGVALVMVTVIFMLLALNFTAALAFQHEVNSPRDPASGIVSPRDSASGLPTGIVAPRDVNTGG